MVQMLSSRRRSDVSLILEHMVLTPKQACSFMRQMQVLGCKCAPISNWQIASTSCDLLAPASECPTPTPSCCQGKLHILREEQGVLAAGDPGHTQTRLLELLGGYESLGSAVPGLYVWSLLGNIWEFWQQGPTFLCGHLSVDLSWPGKVEDVPVWLLFPRAMEPGKCRL